MFAIPNINISQSIEKLDEKNGFKDIKINSHIKEYFDYVYVHDNKRFRFKGECCKKVFDMDIVDILLTVDDQNLIKQIDIAVVTYDEGRKKSGYLTEQFVLLFGKPTNYTNDNPDFMWLWKGKKIYLFLKERYLGYKEGWIPLITVGRVSDINLNNDDGF